MRRVKMPKVKKVPQPTQELAKAMLEEISAGLPAGSFVVTNEFEEYKIGDVFPVPEGWVFDEKYTELLYTKSKGRQGVCFAKPSGGRVILPVKEVDNG
jgi:hypothetical protein